MNAPQTFIAVAPHFTREWLEACVDEMTARQSAASKAHHWTVPQWGAVGYFGNIAALAIDCLVEMDGEEPETNNPQAELSDLMDECCVSILSAIERRMMGRAAA